MSAQLQMIIAALIFFSYPTVCGYFKLLVKKINRKKEPAIPEPSTDTKSSIPDYLFKNKCERKIQINILNFKDMRQAKELLDLTKTVIDNSTVDANNN